MYVYFFLQFKVLLKIDRICIVYSYVPKKINLIYLIKSTVTIVYQRFNEIYLILVFCFSD